jgi:hypothetical protein
MGNGMGNRAYVELAPLFIVGFGFAYVWLQQVRDWPRRAVLALLLLGATVNYTLMGLKLTDRLDGHDPLLAWEKRIFTGRWQRF